MNKGIRFITTTVASVLTFAGLASPLSPQQALLRARHELSAQTDNWLRRTVSTADCVPAATFTSGGKAALYLFVSPEGGYMVIPADDNALPVLGYGSTGSLDASDIPAAMRWWLEGIASEVAECAASGQKTTSAIRTEKAPIEPMLATVWDQGTPFNALCPEMEGIRTYTGCAATAMAQTMNFFRFPATGSRSVTYSWQGQTLSMNFAETTFEWDNMLADYGSGATNAQKNAVATLMKACGYSLKSNYSTTATEAKPQDIVPALVRNFGYARSTMLLYRQFYQLGEWQDSVYKSLSSGSPVVYTGQGSAGGHAFVCDGYQGDGFFHFNWGWSGKSDGWFRLSALNPEALGTGGGAGGFNSAQTAVMHLRPAYSGAAYVPAMGTGDGYAITCSSDASTLTLTGGIYNYATSAMNYSAGFSIEPLGEGEMRYIGAGNWNLTEMLYGYSSYTRETGGSLSAGQYRVRAAYQWRDATGNVQWLNALVPVSSPASWILTVGDTATIAPESRDIHLSASGWKLKSPAYALHAGLNLSVEAEISNSGSEEATTEFYTLFYRAGSAKPSYTLSSATMTIRAGGKELYDFFGAIPGSMTPGHYIMYMGVKEYGKESYTLLTDSIGVDILPPCETITLKAPAWELSDSDKVDGDNIRVNMTLTCTKGCYANPLLFFFQEKNADGTFTTFGNRRSEAIWLNQGDTAQYSFVMAMPSYKPKAAYRLLVNYKNAEGKNTYLCRTEFTTLGVSSVCNSSFGISVEGNTLRVEGVESADVQVFNMSGVAVMAGSGNELDLRVLPAGVYVVRANDGEKSATRKILKKGN